MNRRNFIMSVAALAAIPMLPPMALQEKIKWVEQGLDYNHQFAIIGEYNGMKQAIRLRKRVEYVNAHDKQKMKQILTDWFYEKGADA